jgi:hypothetical protein
MGICLVAASCGTQDGDLPTTTAPGASDVAQSVAESVVASAPAVGEAPVASVTDWQARRPLVVIPVTLTRNRFEGPLDAAIISALARKPDLGLDLVSVAPILNSPKDQEKVDEIARASAGEVLLALSRLGLTGTRVASYSLADPTAATPEIRLYPR